MEQAGVEGLEVLAGDGFEAGFGHLGGGEVIFTVEQVAHLVARDGVGAVIALLQAQARLLLGQVQTGPGRRQAG